MLGRPRHPQQQEQPTSKSATSAGGIDDADC
jgi:hypothetical protein